MDGSGDPDTFFGPNGNPIHRGRAELIWLHEESKQRYVFEAASEGTAADFYLALPPGHYALWFTLNPNVFVEHDYRIRFEVRPGVVACVGTLRFVHDYLPEYGNGRSVQLRDGCDEIAERFRASHPEIVGEVNEELFQKYVWIGGTLAAGCPRPGASTGRREVRARPSRAQL